MSLVGVRVVQFHVGIIGRLDRIGGAERVAWDHHTHLFP
jgi:hypothetical protein